MLALGVTPVGSTRAQAVTLSALRTENGSPRRNVFDGRTLSGLELAVSRHVRSEVVSLGLAARAERESDAYLGTLCGAFGPLENCQPEPLVARYRHEAMTARLAIDAFNSRRFAAQFVTDGGFGAVHIRETSVGTRQARASTRVTFEAEVGVAGWWWLTTRAPIALRVGAAVGWTQPLSLSTCADCWLPLDGSIHRTQLTVGLSYAPRRPRSSR
jgi:hypothetical protein